jgi:voltage-gated potassium channel
VRLFKLAQLTRRVFSTDGIRDVSVLALIVILGAGAAFAEIENGHHHHPISAWDGVWWAITTVTTVGYGDISPATDAGRVIGIVVMFVGIGLVAILTAAAAGRFMRAQEAERTALETVEQRLDEVLRRLDAMDDNR